MLMIEPPPPSIILGTACFEVRTMLLRLTSITRCQSSSSTVTTLPETVMPTLLTRTLSPP